MSLLVSSAALLELAAPTRDPRCAHVDYDAATRRPDLDDGHLLARVCPLCNEAVAFRHFSTPQHAPTKWKRIRSAADVRARDRAEAEKDATRRHGWRDSGAR